MARTVYLPDKPVITMERMIRSSHQHVAEVTAYPAAVAQAGYFADEFVFDATVGAIAARGLRKEEGR